jgi:molybdopterin-guanine dinucleotide biosynthesis protein A
MEQITGIILAGGKSSRMGTDKGLLRLNGKPMIQHILDPMAKICQRILIVTGNPMYGMFGFELVKDEAPDYGPVMGILSGLKQSNTERNLVLCCDSPFVTFDLLKELVLSSDDTAVVAAFSEKGIHPLIAVYKRSCIPAFENAIMEDEHRLRTVLESLDVHELHVKDEESVRNVNTQADMKA